MKLGRIKYVIFAVVTLIGLGVSVLISAVPGALYVPSLDTSPSSTKFGYPQGGYSGYWLNLNSSSSEKSLVARLRIATQDLWFIWDELTEYDKFDSEGRKEMVKQMTGETVDPGWYSTTQTRSNVLLV
jgi:hypothetical protein